MTTSPAATDTHDAERSTGRLFGLSDAVFAIAMTLLALDLRVPDINGATNASLTKALLGLWPHYVSFLLSFYVIATYWMRHNAEMRTVHASHPALVKRTITLLLFVCVLPFAADLLGSYGSKGTAVAVYAGINVLATGALLAIRYEARNHRLTDTAEPARNDLELWINLVALLLAVPSGFLFPGRGPWILVGLLAVSGAVGPRVDRARRAGAARKAAPDSTAESDD